MKEEIKKWSEMTKPEKRVALAKDVLKLTKQDNIKFSSKYLKLETVDELIDDDWKKQVSKNKDKIKSCTVCAKGALFVANVFRNNHCTFNQLDNFCGDDKRLQNLFGNLQYDMIETAFEGRVYNDESEKLEIITVTYHSIIRKITELGKKCIDFTKGCKSSKERLEKIMKNIIKNNGTFIP